MRVDLSSFDYSKEEFKSLFTAAKIDQPKKSKLSDDSGDGKKKAVQIIDAKRVMNGGIVLARLKINYDKIASQFTMMEAGSLDASQLQTLQKFLPSDEEVMSLQKYA